MTYHTLLVRLGKMHSLLNKEQRKTASDLSSTDHVSVVKVGVEIKLRIVIARLISACVSQN